MQRTLIKAALNRATGMDSILVKGWVRTRRDSKGFSFLEINDGSCLKNMQVIVDETAPAFHLLKDVGTGAALEVAGALVESPGAGQKWEVKASGLRLLGMADPETFPLQKKLKKFLERSIRMKREFGPPEE
jgi:asparaginyl-tRNA synthetase